MVARRIRRPHRESPLPDQIASQRAVVNMHQKAIQAGDASRKRTGISITGFEHMRLEGRAEALHAGRVRDHVALFSAQSVVPGQRSYASRHAAQS